ncbi:MAG: hypothetical protein JW891_06705 [Candidatus Lokiarchaeota archaeon]|nr:hypothetical protein [Candidatus Lokiarchaeota archaeon]
MNKSQFTSKKGTLQFYKVNEIYLPKACVACGKKTENTIRKTIFGKIAFSKKERRDYYINLPICGTCSKNSKIGKSIEIAKFLIPTIIALILLGIIAFLTYSILMGLGLVGVSFLVSFLHYKARMRERIVLEKFVQLRSMSSEKDGPEDILEFKFLNKDYAQKMCDINLEQNKILQLVDVIDYIHEDPMPELASFVCPNCGRLQKPEQRFCTGCGIAFTDNQTEITNSSKFIQEASSIISNQKELSSDFNQIGEIQKYSISKDQMEKSCPYCRNFIPSDSMFCTKCGKRL